jgi:pyruvate dehydrogenase E2 component (dihydrolipoamide acetyltransferase)
VEEWKRAPGDWVETGELICIVSIDKAAFDYESPYDGKLVEILVPVSAIVSPGTPIARIDVVHESE